MHRVSKCQYERDWCEDFLSMMYCKNLQVALLNALAEGGALHLLPASKVFPDTLQGCFVVKTPSPEIVQIFMQLLMGKQMQKACEAHGLVWELAKNTIQAFLSSGETELKFRNLKVVL